MTYLQTALKQKEKELKQYISELEQHLAPIDDTLEIVHKNGRKLYYRAKKVHGQQKPIRQYISNRDQSLIRQLAQHPYDLRVLHVLRKQLHGIQLLLKTYDDHAIDHIYERLSTDRRELIQPVRYPASEMIRQWLATTQGEQNPYPNNTDFFTFNKEHVRSKSELILADTFARFHIPYRYEAPLRFRDGSIRYPDFSLWNRRSGKLYYWEHLGKMDDTEYCKKQLIKFDEYEKNGIFPGEQLIITHETRDRPLNLQIVELLIRKYLL